MWNIIGAIFVIVTFVAMILTIIATHEQWNKKVIISLFFTMAASFLMTFIAALNANAAG